MPRDPSTVIPPITTQRAYTLRLRGADANDTTWRESVWTTHEAVNKGVKEFGDWLLTMRGGLSHDLAEPQASEANSRLAEKAIASIRRSRRILLALSWLSVEDERGAPTGSARVATGREPNAVRCDGVLAALQEILAKRGLCPSDIDSWVDDCSDSLSAKIREDAVWVNRSTAFDSIRAEIGDSLNHDEVWDMLAPFFRGPDAYFAGVELDDDDAGAEEKAKDLVQAAGQWLSSRFGTGKGADFEAMAKAYAAMSSWAEGASAFSSGEAALASLSASLSTFHPRPDDAAGILRLISGPGYKSASRNIIVQWSGRAGAVLHDDLTKFGEATAANAGECQAKVGGKGRRPWSDRVLECVERQCGFTYLQSDGPARHAEFAVMLDHAARRVSIGHSWIKRAEAERRRFEVDAQRLAEVPADARRWLDSFVSRRSSTSGATDAGGEYRIRRRAIEGWDEIVKLWKRDSFVTESARIAAARETQNDPDIEKFGDIQLFEALADEGARCVWQQCGSAVPALLKDYVFGTEAKYKQRHFKVPAFRHPDALCHPVFCDFGNSRWSIEYSVHEAAKALRAKRKPSAAESAWLQDRHSVRLGLWNGTSVSDVSLRWSSKRLATDIALPTEPTSEGLCHVSRADRLACAAVGCSSAQTPTVAGLFGLDEWNGRLQAPRGQLNSLARRIQGHGWDARAKQMRDQIKWLVTFSAKLECNGPFIQYARTFGANAPAKPFVSQKKGELAIKHEGQDQRHGHAKLALSRLPNLRVLSVDLGHRFAAACAVWQALDSNTLAKEVAGREIATGALDPSALYLHTRHADPNTGKPRTTIYRRIGTETLADGTSHPAPWARLDRQFLIKLPGEETAVRAASSKPEHGVDEVAMVAGFRKSLGKVIGSDDARADRAVDQLMRRTVGDATTGLKRHARVAKIAYALNPNCQGIPGTGGSLNPIVRGDEAHIRFLTDALFEWHALATDAEWDGTAARTLWNSQIAPRAGGFRIDDPSGTGTNADRPTRQQKRKQDDELRESRLAPIARAIDEAASRAMHASWKQLWERADGKAAVVPSIPAGQVGPAKTAVAVASTGWHAHIRTLTDWIMGWHLEGADGETWRQNVGGLGLTRISTMRSLYQLHKAFHMRARPERLQGAPERGESNSGIAQGILSAMERMRDQRVKQIASRIVEAALGVGRHSPVTAGGRDRKRPSASRDPVCHAVVIENLRNYRPDELQTRRENKALMSWSSSKVRKYLAEGCQLNGLHLREVQPNYTSRQCSRTGLPGMRCEDVPISEFLNTQYWSKVVGSAKTRLADGGGDSVDRFFQDLHEHWSGAPDAAKTQQKVLRISKNGADLFVAAPSDWSRFDPVRAATQADLNAAANIGLRALLDPDFIGRWWYVPCDSATGVPAKDKCAGAGCLDHHAALIQQPRVDAVQSGKARNSKSRGEKEKTNAWRDLGSEGGWRVHGAYWADVRKRVIARLRVFNGLAIDKSS